MYVCALIETSCSTCEIVHGVDYSQGLLRAVACFFATTSVRVCSEVGRPWRYSSVLYSLCSHLSPSVPAPCAHALTALTMSGSPF